MAVVPAVLCAVLLGQVLVSGRRLSQTADEATHLFAGYRYLKCGDLTVSPEHPPLAKSIAAAPLLSMRLPVDCSPSKGNGVEQAVAAQSWLYKSDWRTALDRARTAASVFALALCLLVWIAAGRMFGFATALVATVLLVFEPNVLANAALVMTDVPVTAMLLFAVFGYYLWIRKRTLPFLLLAALAAGLTLSVKNSGVIILPILAVLAVTEPFLQEEDQRSPWKRARRNLLAAGAICTLAFAVVWAGYGMRFAAPGLEIELALHPPPTSIGARVVLTLVHALPQAYLQGLVGTFNITDQSGPVFVLGKTYLERPWFAIPAVILVRSTVALLAMMVLAAGGLPRLFGQRRRELLFLIVPVGIFLAVCLHSSCDIGIRYLLPIFPFLLILVAAGCVEAAKRVRWLSYAVPCLIVLHAASSLHAFPNYLSYANELWGGPAKAYQSLSWVDIGQAYPEARAYLEKHPADHCWMLTGWQWDAGLYGLPCQTVGYYLPGPIPPHMNGTVIVSSTLLTIQRPDEEEAIEPFKNARPAAYLGGSALLVYQGDFDTRGAAAMYAGLLEDKAKGKKDSALALKYADEAVALDPAYFMPHWKRCDDLSGLGQLTAALAECEQARALAVKNPFRAAPQVRMIEGNIQRLRTQLAQVRYSSNP